MRNTGLYVLIVASAIIAAETLAAPQDKQIALGSSLKIAAAFQMKTSLKAAHEQAAKLGLDKTSSKKVNKLQVVSYKGPAQVKLIFSPDNALTCVMVRLGTRDKSVRSAAFSFLKEQLGTPTEVYQDELSGFYAGVDFDTIVYASWPYYLLSENDDGVWLERSWSE